VLIDARRRLGRPTNQPPGDQTATVIDLGALARYDRPAPTLTDYDQLLTGSQTQGASA